MNVGGSGGSASWNGEMAPRMLITSVPYAFRSAEATSLKSFNGANSTTLTATAPTGTNSILLPDASGTVCLQSSSACGFASLSGANTFTGVNTFSSAGTALQVTNNATIGGTLGVTGLTTASGGLTTGNGSLFTNGGATLNNTLAIGNLDYSGSGNTGSIGAAASTVDIYTNFTIAQTTAGQTITLPAPTSTTTGRLIYVTNVGSAGYNMAGSVVSPGVTMQFVWNNTTSSWSLVTSGTSGSYIQNGTSIQTANFNIQSNAVGSVTATIQGANSQTANILEVKQAGVGTAVFSISAAGDGTFSNNLTVNGNTIIGNATTDRLTLTSQLLGQDALVFQGATDDGFTTTFRVTDPTANNILTLPNETGTICTTGSVCSGYAPSATNGYVQFAPASAQADATNNASIYIDKTSATGNLLQLQRSATDVVSVSNTGQALFRNTSNSATAFRIQRSTSDNIFTVETNNNRIKVGNDSAGSGADTTLFIVDTATTANQPTGVNGGIFYDTTLGKFRCYENGSYKDCDTGVTAVGAVSGTSTANGATITGTTINLTPADGSNGGVLTSGAQTIGGAKTFNSLVTGSAGASVTGGAVTLTGNAASSFTTTAGALTLTSASTATWSTTAGNLTLQAGSGTVSLGTSTALTASGALGITSGGANALTLDTGGASTLSVGTANANAVSISRTGITTTVNGNLTVAETVNLNGNTTIGNATTDRLTVTSQLLGQDALVFQGATDDGFTTTFRVTDPTANNILTLPNESGTICTTGSVCTGYAPSATNGYVQFAPASAQTDATNNSSIFINKTSGTGNILQLQKAGNDALVVANNGYVGLGGSATNRLTVTDTQAANSGYVAAQNISQTFTPTSANYSTWAMGMNVTTSLGAGTTVDSSNVNANIRGIYAEAANFSGQTIYASYGVTGASGIGSGAGGAITNAYGAQGYVYQNGAGTITNAFPVFSEVRSTGAGQIINATGFYGDLSVTAGTVGEYTLLKAADYSSIVGANQFGVITYGKSRFGDNTLPTEVLEVAGNISVTAANSYKIGGVIAMEASGGYLRLNQSNQFAQGIYTGTSGLRVGGTTGILVGSIGADGQIGIIPNGVDTTRRITLDGGTGAITAIGVNSGTGLIQGTGGLTITGTTNINATGTAATNIGNGTGTLALLGGNSSSWIVGTGGNTTTLNFTAPSGANTITFPAASGTVQVSPSGSGYSLVQVPTSNTAGANGANVISPTAASITGLTVNGTSNATGATALIVNQVNATATGAAFNLTNASGVQTNGVLINRNTAGGTTTNLLNLTNTAGTATNGIIFNGTIGTDITTAAARNLNIITATTGQLNLDTGSTGQINIGTNANSKTIQIGAGGATAASSTVNIATSTGAAQTVSIGSNSTTSTTNIYGGTGNINLITNSASAGTTVRTNTNSDSAFRVQNSSGVSMLRVDTENGRVIIGDDLVPSGATARLYFGDYGLGSNVFVGEQSTTDTDILQLQGKEGVYLTVSGAPTNVLTLNNNGDATFKNIANSATAFQVQNAAGNALVNVDTTSRIVTVGSQLETNTVNVGTVGSAAFSSTVNIGNSTGAAQTVNIGSTNGASSLNLSSGTGLINLNSTNLQFVSGADRTINVATQTSANTAGNNLTVVAATGNGTGVGGTLTLQGGTGGSANANGGNLILSGGLPGGTGTKGLVVIDTPTFATASAQNCGTSCTITQANVNNNGVVLVNATAPSLLVTLPDPTTLTAGRVVYVTAGLGSNDFTLVVNGGGTGNEIAMRANTTATMIWNGTDWTAAGASSSTTLQAAYNNTLTSAGGAEIVLNNTSTSNGLTVRNNDSNPIIGGIFEAQTSIGSNLFSVNNNATDYANNGGAEGTTFTMWTAAPAGGTVTRYTTAGDNIATGTASVSIGTAGANQGARNTLTTTLTPNLKYSVSYAVRGPVNFATLDTVYSRDGTNTSTTACETGATVTTGIWTRINCTFIAPASGITASNAIFIRQSDGTARTIYVDNLSLTVSADINHAADGSADDAGNFATNWTAAPAGGTVTRNTSTLYDTSGSAQVVTAATANQGLRNNMAITPAINTQYLVSFYARSTNAFNDINVQYSRDGGTSLTSCVDYNTNSVSTTGFTKITCLFTTDGTAASNPDLIIRQTSGTARTFYIDALTVTLNTNNSSNVQIGGGNKGGPTTLFTLDRGDSPPIAANNDTYLGSMYYDTTTGRIQCYEADGWGACGSAPDNIVNLNPEYAGAVLNGTGVGTMIADLCASGGGLNVNDGTSGSPTLCSSGEAKNFYKWTSPQATQQTYSIYVSYQLPSTFKGFASDDTVQLTARVDNTTNAAVTYEMFRSESGTITKCGTGETAVTTSNNVWQTVGINGNESTGCSFGTASAGAFVIFKINVKANSNANAYVSTLNFVTTGR